MLGAEEVPGLPGIHGTKLFHGGTLLKSPFREPSGDRGKVAGVLGAGEAATGLALRLQLWSADVTVYTHGGRLQEEAAARLEERGVRVVTQRLTAVEGTGRQLERIRLSDGSSRPCDLLYYTSVSREPVEATLPLSGAAADGVFTLAHASTNPAVATAEGFRTGEMIHRWLLQQEQRAAAGAPNH